MLVRDGIRRMYGARSREDCFYYLTLYNENYVQPPMPEGVEDGIVRGMYLLQPAPGERTHRAQILASGPMVLAGARGAGDARRALRRRRRRVERARLEAAPRRRASTCERWNRLHPAEPPRTPYVTEQLAPTEGPIVAVTDWVKAVPDRSPGSCPSRTWCSAPTATASPTSRSALRRHFEIDAAHVVVAVLDGLAQTGDVKAETVAEAIRRYEIDPDGPDPRTA